MASLGYHEVTDTPRSTGFQRPGAAPFTLTPATFADHLARVTTGPCCPALVTGLDLDRPGRHLLLTFDDGGKSALLVADELSRRGWRGHFFIVTGRVGNRTFLDWSEVRYLRQCGHVVGSHSHTHPDIFRELSPARMREEWRISGSLLAERLGEPCVAASVPGGEISPAVLQSVAEVGMKFLFTVEPDLRPHRVGGCWVLGRCLIKNKMPPSRVGELVQFRGWTRALVIRRLKAIARLSLPLLYRHLVARRVREFDSTHA